MSRVLVLDDSSLMCNILRRMLTLEGYEVIAFTCPVAALKHLWTEPNIDLIITDLHMPEMNGLQFANRVQQISSVEDRGVIDPPPMVLLTSTREGSPVERHRILYGACIASGMFRYIYQKPIERDVLLPTIRLLLNDTRVLQGAAS